MASRWTYSFSNLGPKKTIGSTTFYKVHVGGRDKWLSMSGIKMIEKAREAGASLKDVMKAARHYTGQGTQRRLSRMRANIREGWAEYTQGMVFGDDPTKLAKGIRAMSEKYVDTAIFRDMDRLLNLMTEEELRTLAKENKLLLSKYFADSEPLKGATRTTEEIESSTKNVNKNAKALRDKMMEIISRRGVAM